MHRTVLLQQLSDPERRLIALLQDLNFGRIERLHVTGGEPCFDQPPDVFREIRFGSENGPRPERALSDFQLSADHRALLNLIRSMDEGVVEHIDVRHGLPFRAVVASPLIGGAR